MTEFRVGDMVEIIGNRANHCFEIGHIGMLTEEEYGSFRVDNKMAGRVSKHDIKLIRRQGMKYELGQVLRDNINEIEIVEVNNGFYHYKTNGKISDCHYDDNTLDRAGYKPVTASKEVVLSMDEIAEKFGIDVSLLKVKKD